MLNGKIELHGIKDPEAFCARVIEGSHLKLSHHDKEDLLAELLEVLWELSVNEQFDPTRGSFSTYAQPRLRRQVGAWLRRPNERTGRTGFIGGRTKWRFAKLDPATGKPKVHTRELPKFHSIDDQPGIVDEYGPMEAGSDRLPSTGRLFGTGDSEDPRRDNGMGEDAVRTAA
jgi:hypothetical protein